MSSRVWIVGPVAVDTVAYLKKLPSAGSFTRPERLVERIGGSSANVAIALAATGVETGFISYIGNDANGQKIRENLSASKIKHLHLQEVDGQSNHALVMIDSSKDRTIVALTDSHLDELTLSNIAFESTDIVVFSLWRPFFFDHLRLVQSLGCRTIVGLEALKDLRIEGVECAIGSESELGGEAPTKHLNRFQRIVVTRGASGADDYQGREVFHQEAIAGKVIDTTGAGDSFLAGFLAILARGDGEIGTDLAYGARWAAATISREGSQPEPPPL